MPLTIIVKLEDFTGISQGGLLGNTPGQVFFSPALTTPAANSTIQVDEVDVCVRAYDTYIFPVLLDPDPLYTYPISPGATVPISTLGAVLWALPPRLAEASFAFGWQEADTISPPIDSRAIATLEEPLDSTKVSFLNNAHWKLYDGIDPAFITADNLAPILPGPTTVITLEP